MDKQIISAIVKFCFFNFVIFIVFAFSSLKLTATITLANAFIHTRLDTVINSFDIVLLFENSIHRLKKQNTARIDTRFSLYSYS